MSDIAFPGGPIDGGLPAITVIPADASAMPGEVALTQFLQALAVFNPAKFTDAMTLIMPGRKALAAAEEFERRVCWHPFLSTGETETRRFDPPGATEAGERRARGGMRVLRLRCGILSLDTLFTDVTPQSPAGFLLTEDDDYYLTDSLGNYDVVQRKVPYSQIHFNAPQWGAHRSIAATGIFGFCAALPWDAYEAILQFGAYLCLAEIRLNISRGLFSYKDLNTEIRYASGTSVALAREETMWRNQFLNKCVRYARPVVV